MATDVTSTDSFHQERSCDPDPTWCCEILGHKWTAQIVAALLSGPHRFSAIHAAVSGIGEKVLSHRLAELEQDGIVLRSYYPEIPPRVEYRLTDAGFAMRAVIVEMGRWSECHAPT